MRRAAWASWAHATWPSRADASFAFTEARIGVAPAMISLTTLDLMHPRPARRYYLTGETFGASAAAGSG